MCNKIKLWATWIVLYLFKNACIPLKTVKISKTGPDMKWLRQGYKLLFVFYHLRFYTWQKPKEKTGGVGCLIALRRLDLEEWWFSESIHDSVFTQGNNLMPVSLICLHAWISSMNNVSPSLWHHKGTAPAHEKSQGVHRASNDNLHMHTFYGGYIEKYFWMTYGIWGCWCRGL